MNINSLSFHFDELQSLISKSKNDFQIIGISDIRLKKTHEKTTTIQLENYNIEHVPTELANGGMLLFIKKAYHKMIRLNDLIKKMKLESVFIEIIQKDSNNIIVGCMQQSEFNDEYLKPLSK